MIMMIGDTYREYITAHLGGSAFVDIFDLLQTLDKDITYQMGEAIKDVPIIHRWYGLNRIT